MAKLGTCSGCSGWSHMDMDWHHFSPRVGFTYQLTPKTVLLGGASWYWLDTGAFEYGVNKVAVNYGNNLNGLVSIGQPAPQIPGLVCGIRILCPRCHRSRSAPNSSMARRF